MTAGMIPLIPPPSMLRIVIRFPNVGGWIWLGVDCVDSIRNWEEDGNRCRLEKKWWCQRWWIFFFYGWVLIGFNSKGNHYDSSCMEQIASKQQVSLRRPLVILTWLFLFAAARFISWDNYFLDTMHDHRWKRPWFGPIIRDNKSEEGICSIW